MKTINERLNELQPYVSSIRFVKDVSVVDTFFKEGWTLPKSTTIGNEVVKDKPNYYMLYSAKPEIGLDEILDYVERTIFLNEEREQKYELLKLKVGELQILFRDNSLVKCKTLEFVFPTAELKADDLSINDIPLNEPEVIPILEEEVEEVVEETPVVTNTTSDEVNEWNSRNSKVGGQTIELPPKKEKVVLEEFNEPEIICNCGPNDACPVCIDN